MKGENLFLLAIVGIGAWWLFRDAARQTKEREAAIIAAAAAGASPEQLELIKYADLPQRRGTV